MVWKAQYRPAPNTDLDSPIFQLQTFFYMSTSNLTYQGDRYTSSSPVKPKNSIVHQILRSQYTLEVLRPNTMVLSASLFPQTAGYVAPLNFVSECTDTEQIRLPDLYKKLKYVELNQRLLVHETAKHRHFGPGVRFKNP